MTGTGNVLTPRFLTELAAIHRPPCLSLYQPTHRRHPENQQDPIRFRNLIGEMKASLSQGYPAGETASMFEPFDALGRDHEFWNHTSDGLAVFGRGNFTRLELPFVQPNRCESHASGPSGRHDVAAAWRGTGQDSVTSNRTSAHRFGWEHRS
jgi:hypothetical protein